MSDNNLLCRNNMKEIIILITALLMLSSSAYAVCPDDSPIQGFYKNYSFGFSIRIPSGLKGMWNSAACVDSADGGCMCMSDHGRYISLGEEDYIEVYASHAIEDNEALGELVHRSFDYLREKADKGDFVVLDLHQQKLHTLPALYYRAEYEKNDKTRIREVILSQSKSKGKSFTITLDTSDELVDKHQNIFKAIVRSWRPTKRSEY